MTFQEKSIWVTVVVTVIIFGYYFTQAIIIISNPSIPEVALIGLFIGVTVITIIVQIVLQSVLAIANRKDAEKGEDERDKLIELKATRISYFILIFGVWTTCISILIISSTIILANLLLFFFIIAELTGFISQLIYYRRGF